MRWPALLPARLAVAGGTLAGIALATGALAGWWRGSPPAARLPLLRASATIEPPAALFGDTLVARVDVVVDSSLVAPSSVEVAAGFAPYTAGEPVVARAGSHVSYTYRLSCLTDACLPRKRGFVFAPATVRARARGGRTLTAEAPWPTVAVASRLTAADVASAQPAWRESTQLAPVTWGIDPRLLAGVLAGSAALLALGAGALAALALRRRRGSAPVRQEQERPPVERALARVRLAARAGGPEERRRALEQLAHALRERGEPELARAAIRLAWSGERPAPERVAAFADQVARGEGKG